MTSVPLPTAPDASRLLHWSAQGSVAVMFPRTRSAAYDAAVSVARQAEHYAEQQLGASLFHFAGFGRSRAQAQLAYLVIHNMRAVKGFQAFGRGAQVVEWSRAERVLQCYIQACGCDNPAAHCLVMTGDQQQDPFPCRWLHSYGFRPQAGHPASLPEQIQAAAVRQGCDWCPFFQPREN